MQHVIPSPFSTQMRTCFFCNLEFHILTHLSYSDCNSNAMAGTGSWSFVASKAGQQEFGEISGSKGRIKFQFFLSSKVEVWSDEEGHKEYNDPMPAHVQQPIISAVVQALRGEGECVSTGESALRTSLVMDGILQGQLWS